VGGVVEEAVMERENKDTTKTESVASVLARAGKREHEDQLEITGPGGVFHGLLFAPPRLGVGLVIYRLGEGDILKTTPVCRVATDPDGSVLVQTMNSTYRLARPAARAAVEAA
jgi:hypothetical protein